MNEHCKKCSKPIVSAILHRCKPYHERSSVRSFTVTVEAEIIHRREMSAIGVFSDPSALPWRAVVRIGSHMEWQWHRTRKDAVDWINSWRNKGKPLVEILASDT